MQLDQTPNRRDGDPSSPEVANPVLSVILISPDTFDTVRQTALYLSRQTICQRIELVLCLPSLHAAPSFLGLAAPEENAFLNCFHSVVVVEMGDCQRVATAKAAGIRTAAAEYVAFIEEHAFPSPRWAESLVARLSGGYAAAGATMVNPNPRLPASWAIFVVEYGPWAIPSKSGGRQHLPGNNGSYRKELLLSMGERLEDLLDAESILQWELAGLGHGLWLEDQAWVYHINITRFSAYWKVHFHYGRMFAASRCQDWSMLRRFLYASGAGVIPFIRLNRHYPDVFRAVPDGNRGAKFWFWLLLGLFTSAIGEGAGYLLGAGNARLEVFRLEFHRTSLLDGTDAVEYPPLADQGPLPATAAAARWNCPRGNSTKA